MIPPGSKPIKAGLFEGGKPMTMVPLGTSVPSGSVVAATVERQGGVDKPTADADPHRTDLSRAARR